jgi:hypothetical protein
MTQHKRASRFLPRVQPLTKKIEVIELLLARAPGEIALSSVIATFEEVRRVLSI